LLILDTNIISELMRGAPNPAVIAWLDRQDRQAVWISAITVLELHHGIQVLSPGRRQVALLEGLNRLIAEKIGDRVASFDAEAARATAMITAGRRRSGRTGELRDSMIAGIAMTAGATLATRYTRHFDDLSITLIDPWTA
jgi:predicted nucleic acid-binding protein